MKLQQNFITNNNLVKEGLNFIVPALWWKKFLNQNESIHSFRQMRTLPQSPLELLYEVGIIQQHSSKSVKSSESIKKYLHEVYNSIKRQIKQSRRQQSFEEVRKRQLISNQFLFQTTHSQRQSQDLFLCSPDLNQNIIELFEMGEDAWVLIAPELYRQIWLKQLESLKDKKNRKLIAIPIIMRKQQIQSFNKPLLFNNRKNVEICLNKKTGQNLLFEGFVEEDLTINQLINYLEDGLFRLLRGVEQEKQTKWSNILLVKHNNSQIYYSCKTQKIFQNLGWIQFEEIKDKILRESRTNFRLCVIQTSIVQVQDIQIQDTENNNQLLHNQPSKKIKLDTDVNIAEKESENVNIIQQYVLGDLYQNQANQTAQQIQEEQRGVDDLTNVETGCSERRNRNAVNNNSPQKLPDFIRIPYPIWKQNHQIQHLVKYGQLKLTVPKIFIPYGDQSTLILKEDGKKTVLPKSSNKLIKKEDQLAQNQIEEPTIELKEYPPSESVHRQLQILALQILGIKITEEMLDEQKIEQIYFAKKDSDEQIKTCKNDFMDQFDCEQSRQF